MNWKTWVPLALAIVLGVAAMKLANDFMKKRATEAAKDPGKQVVVLKKDIPAGVQITAEDLGTTKMAGEMNMDAIFTNPADVEGRVLSVPAAKGAPVLQTMLAPKGAGTGLQSLIPDGMRAITIEINEFSGVAGNLTAGSRVDLMTTINGEAGTMVSRTIVQNIKVQALGMRRPPEGNGNDQGGGATRSVTLLVTPKEAETIELAATLGRPRLVLRGTTDNETGESSGVTVAELRNNGAGTDPFGAQTAELIQPHNNTAVAQSTLNTAPTSQPNTQALARPAARPRDRQVKVIRGGVESTTTVPEFASPAGLKWMTGAGMDELPGNENN